MRLACYPQYHGEGPCSGKLDLQSYESIFSLLKDKMFVLTVVSFPFTTTQLSKFYWIIYCFTLKHINFFYMYFQNHLEL